MSMQTLRCLRGGKVQRVRVIYGYPADPTSSPGPGATWGGCLTGSPIEHFVCAECEELDDSLENLRSEPAEPGSE